MYLPTIKQLQYLLAVVELRHFGQAAERCFVTQSTLSSAIQELEALLGVQLLERTKRKVLPTPTGLELAEQARKILKISYNIIELSNSSKKPLCNEVRLGVIPTIAPFLLPKVLLPLHQAFPELSLLLIEDQSAHLMRRLESGEIDCAILALPYPTEKLESQLIGEEGFWVAMPEGDPLTRKRKISAAELPMERLLLLEEGHCLRDHAMSTCGGSEVKAQFQGSSLYTLIEMVAWGQGVTLVPAMALESPLLKHARIELRPLDAPTPHRQMALVWRATSYQKNNMVVLADKLAELMVG
ncbi:Hydrogen peroxide-inducible genes activator =_ OxyR [hydrothermal vent metagenome]|uniref:Hydrogen peroxide-inducible genes activator => OxyR n=1 Tax=hydrothermal vent metagenome TaxID=652676 RepID=A0A3B0Z4P2_9ZZZZ